MVQSKFKQLVLVILDGFGVASKSEGNAITLANPRNFNYLVNNFPSTTLQASGPAVGLPWGEIGNSETGHMNLGAGRIVSQDLPRISRAIYEGGFFDNAAFLNAVEHVKNNNSKLHLIGLVSPGGVHSSEEHLHALLELAARNKVREAFVHVFTDGRDTAPKVALESLDRLSRKFLESGIGKVATLTGRFYAMDRGGHWEVTEKTYKALVLGEGRKSESARLAVQSYYGQQITDEVIPPTVIVQNGASVAKIEDNDALIFLNFRPDRISQLTRAFAEPDFELFGVKYPALRNLCVVTMTLYDKISKVQVAFPPIEIKKGLSETISKNNLKQFHVSESEKYAHVTSFFDGGRVAPWPLEEQEIVGSPQSYEKRYMDEPQMSVAKVADRIIAKVKEGVSFIVANIANPDMVGHTGDRDACIAAINSVDQSLGMIFKAALEAEACLVITADHGNIEEILDVRTGMVNKEHTFNPVPFLLIGKGLNLGKIKEKGYLELPSVVPEGVLSDAAPTVLDLLGIPKPTEMSAIPLLPALFTQVK